MRLEARDCGCWVHILSVSCCAVRFYRSLRWDERHAMCGRAEDCVEKEIIGKWNKTLIESIYYYSASQWTLYLECVLNRSLEVIMKYSQMKIINKI